MYALPLVLFVTVADYAAYFRGVSQLRFALLLIPGAAYLHYLFRTHFAVNTSASYKPYAALSIYVLLGATTGSLFFGTTSPALSIAAALVVGLIVVDARLTEAQASRLLWWLGTVSTLYILLNAAALTGYADFLSSDPPGNYRHEKAWIIALAFSALVQTRRWLVAGICALLAAYIYTQYAAATYPIVMVVAVATSFVLPFAGDRGGTKLLGIPWRLGATLLAAFITGIYLLSSGVLHLANAYFASVGKEDNVATRLIAIHLAWERVRESPIWGSMFSGDLSLPIPRNQLGRSLRAIEAHNDYLATWMLGGLFALVLLVWWIVQVNRDTYRACQIFGERRCVNHGALASSLLVMFNSFWIVALFNPLLTQLSTSVCMAMSYVCLHALQLSASRKKAAHEIGKASSWA